MITWLSILIFFGTFMIVLKLSSWRNECSKLMAGKKPRFFDILGDAKEFVVYDAWPDIYLYQRRFLDVVTRKTKEYGKHHLFCLWITYIPIVMVVKAKAIKEITEKKIIEKTFVYEWLEPTLGTGLLTSAVSKWKPRRKLLMPCFHSDILRGFFPAFNEHSQKLVEFFREETDKQFIYIEKSIKLLALDIICETMFGVKIGALGNDSFHSSNTAEFVKSFQKLWEIYMKRMFKLWYWPSCIFKLSKDAKEMAYHSQKVHDFTRNIIQQKKMKYLNRKKEPDSGKRKALLDLLLEMHIERGELSEEDIEEEVVTFISAGHETVSITICWAMYVIGLYSDVQAKIHEELDKVFGEDRTRPVSEKDLGDLQYLDCVLKETSRLYPAAPWFGRKSPDDTCINICGNILPKGSHFSIMTYFIHRDEEVFPDPERFDPERFSPENCHKIPEYAYIPFAAGPRNCIGQRFAIMEVKVVIASILRNFSIESIDSRDKIQVFISTTLHPSTPIRIRIRPREGLKKNGEFEASLKL